MKLTVSPRILGEKRLFYWEIRDTFLLFHGWEDTRDRAVKRACEVYDEYKATTDLNEKHLSTPVLEVEL